MEKWSIRFLLMRKKRPPNVGEKSPWNSQGCVDRSSSTTMDWSRPAASLLSDRANA